jgi:hypothetical protein
LKKLSWARSAVSRPARLWVFTVLVFCFTGGPLRSGEALPAPGEQPPAHENAAGESFPDTTVYVVRNITFSRTGITRISALLYHGHLKTGERITGLRNFERYIQRRRQFLINQRPLETAEIVWSTGEREEDGAVPVDLLVITRDSFNYFIFPKPLVDSNSGLDITLKARNYNFLGTLNPLRIDLGYALDYTRREKSTFSDGTFTFLLDSDTPIRLLNLDFNIDFDHEFKFTPNNPFYYQNITGLSVALPVSFTTATIGLRQITTLNEDNERVYTYDGWRLYGGQFEPAYTTTEVFTSWSIPTPLEVGDFGSLTYSPRLSGRVSYRPGSSGWDPGELRRGIIASFGHQIGFGQIDWRENFRQGLQASISNSISYNINKSDFSAQAGVTAAGHLSITRFFGASGRVRYNRILAGAVDHYAGEVIRGIIDKNIQTGSIFSLNADFPFQALLFRPSRWFKKSALRFFDFELHLAPIFDAVLYQDPADDGFTGEAAAGIEIIVFPFFIRRLYIRASFAASLRDIAASGRIGEYEYFIGLEHHY